MKEWYSVEDLSSLNKVNKREVISRLKQLIGKSAVHCGLRVFKIMREIEKSCKPPLTDEILEETAKILKEEKNLVIDLLSKDKRISRRIDYGQLFEPKKRGGQHDLPYDILIYYLEKHLQKSDRIDEKESHYRLIADFLNEQEIKDGISSNAVWKTYNYAEPTLLKRSYEWFWSVYVTTKIPPSNMDEIFNAIDKTQIITTDNPESEKDILFPPWEVFINHTK